MDRHHLHHSGRHLHGFGRVPVRFYRRAAAGLRTDAGIIAVDWDTRFRVNGRCPLVIRCQAVNPADGCVYVFQSEAFWFDPSPFLEGLSTLPVYVDGDNYRRYAVDTQGIVPKQG